jgi:hypothetical protein
MSATLWNLGEDRLIDPHEGRRSTGFASQLGTWLSSRTLLARANHSTSTTPLCNGRTTSRTATRSRAAWLDSASFTLYERRRAECALGRAFG